MPLLPAPTRVRVAGPVAVRLVALAVVLVLAVAVRFGLEGPRALARRFVACFELPAMPCARLRCAPSAAARVNVRPHSGQTNSPPTLPLFVEADRLAVARFFAAGRLFELAIISFPGGRPVISH